MVSVCLNRRYRGSVAAQESPEPDDTRELSPEPDDDTRELSPEPDDTQELPEPASPTVWAGRAQVRSPDPARRSLSDTQQWQALPEPPPRRWGLLVLVTLITVLLVGILGFGVYLIVNATAPNPAVAPVPTESRTPSPTSVDPTPQERTSPAAPAQPPVSPVPSAGLPNEPSLPPSAPEPTTPSTPDPIPTTTFGPEPTESPDS